MGKGPLDFGDAFKSISTGIRVGAQIGKGTAQIIRNTRASNQAEKLRQQGLDDTTVAAVEQAIRDGKTVNQIQAIISKGRERIRKKEERDARAKNPPDIGGRAAWAKSHEIANKGLLPAERDGKGLIITNTRDGGPPVYWGGEGHLVTVADTRTGKSLFQIIPNLLQYERRQCGGA